MKRTKIKYRNMADGRILIEAVENASTYQDIEDAFGREVCQAYQNGSPRYHSCDIYKEVKSYHLHKDYILSKEKFQEAIATMKAAGARLQEIVKFTAEAETKEILI